MNTKTYVYLLTINYWMEKQVILNEIELKLTLSRLCYQLIENHDTFENEYNSFEEANTDKTPENIEKLSGIMMDCLLNK